MNVNINRMYKAMHKVDPNGRYRWYVKTDGMEIEIEALGNVLNTAFQSSTIIYGHHSDYTKFFDEVFKCMQTVGHALSKGENNEQL